MDKLLIEGGVPLIGEVPISGAKNAALGALRILSIHDDSLGMALDAYQEKNAKEVLETPLP